MANVDNKVSVIFDLNGMLTKILNRSEYLKKFDNIIIEQCLLKGLSVALAFAEDNAYFFRSEMFAGEILLYTGKRAILHVKESGFWQITKAEITIDFSTGDIFIKDFTKEEDDYDDSNIGVKWERNINTSIVNKYLESDYVREVSYWIEEEEEIKKALLQKEFTMYNSKNNYAGELTTLNEKDVEDILYDRATVYTNEEKTKLFVRYPHGICLLERDL